MRREDSALDHSHELPFWCILCAKLALLRSDPEQALDALRVAAPHELGLPVYSFCNWPNLYPVYVRGEAYLAAHQGNEAAADFRKSLTIAGLYSINPSRALAHLPTCMLHGDTAKAKSAYQDFLTLWKDADLDIPILIAAKSEYAKLK